MMKNRFFYFGVVPCLLTAVACSDIAEEDRLVYSPARFNRTVLIEDFTGQRCLNCPKATEAIHKIQEVYGDKVIPVAIHCGSGIGGKAGLMTKEGTEYWNHWFVSGQGQPVAKINRGEATVDYANWSIDVVRKGMEMSSDVKINCKCNFDINTNNLQLDINTSADYVRLANLQVWLTEDSVVALQIMPDNTQNKEYIHNHVFRTSVNGTWGEIINYEEKVINKKYEIQLDEKWNADNMHVIVFVYENNNVLEVVQTPLK